MNNIIKYGSILDNPLYNCSAHSPEDWSSLDGVRRPIFGTIDIIYGLIVNIVYVPIIAVMFRPDLFRLSCFKIMIFLSIVDMLAIGVNSLITGFLAIECAVFCTYPNFIYISGMSGLGLWCCSCMSALILVLNRILDLSSEHLCDFFFAKHRTFIVLLAPLIYGSYFMYFTTPPSFSSKYMTWMYDPLIFENRANDYINFSHGFNNLGVVAITCLFYVFFCFSFRRRLKSIKTCNSKSKILSASIFFQSTLICIVNQIASIIYVAMNFIEVPLWLIMFGHILWQFGHGAPVLIYFSMNQTIRSAALNMLGFKKLSESLTLSRSVGTMPIPTISINFA